MTEVFGTRMPTNTAVRATGHAAKPTTEWVVVVPVKGTPDAKSRFGGKAGQHRDLALAIALDTVTVALDTEGVAGVLVITSEAAATDFDATGALVLVEDAAVGAAGLAGAIAQGIDVGTSMSAPGCGVAVLLGDLPALTTEELRAALAAASAHKNAMVPDAAGTGTTLITAAWRAVHTPAFGEGSAAAHAASGYVVLPVDPDSGLRRDVDTLDDLRSLEGRLGPHTSAAL